MMIAFGPVPSRRLGQSLGINNIPPKSCSYSCVYCQVGPTRETEHVPRVFYPPEEIARAVTERVRAVERAGERIDYLTFVPDGEPTLDVNLREAMSLLRPLGYPIAVISNASLASRAEVRETLKKADWLSLKVDAVDEGVWRRINRPDERLSLAPILEGIELLAGEYFGTLTTETMLVPGVNDADAELRAVAAYLDRVAPAVAYLLAPIRPPAEAWVRMPDEALVARAYEIFSAELDEVECVVGEETGSFASTGETEADLLDVMAVHPMREDSVRDLLAKAGAGWEIVQRLLDEGRIVAVEHAGRRFYMQSFSRTARTS